MRIDEFSNASNIEGTISSTEQTQFLLFGFDLAIDAPIETSVFYELLALSSFISKSISYDSTITTELTCNSLLADVSCSSLLGG